MTVWSRHDAAISRAAANRRRRLPYGRLFLVAAIAVVDMAVAAFVAWGPVGLGRGPLTVYAPSGGQLLYPPHQVWGLMVPIHAGSSGAVIDSIALASGGGYASPRVLSIWAVADRPGGCAGAFPWTGPYSVLAYCSAGGLRKLVGVPLPVDNPGVDMVVEIGRSVGPGGCWTIASITVRYHVGIRHYTATGRNSFAACSTQTEERYADLAIGLSD